MPILQPQGGISGGGMQANWDSDICCKHAHMQMHFGTMAGVDMMKNCSMKFRSKFVNTANSWVKQSKMKL